MPGVMTIGDGRVALYILTQRPADMRAPKVAEIKAGKRAACKIMKSGYRLGPTGNTTIAESALCTVGDSNSPGPAQYEGHLDPFVYIDPATGKWDEGDNDVLQILNTPQNTIWLVEREGPLEAQDVAEGDVVRVYEAITGTSRSAEDRTTYIKRPVDLFIQDAALDVKVVA